MVCRVNFLLILLFVFSNLVWSQTPESIDERLARLEEGQKSLNQRIDDLRSDMNSRFALMDKRLEDMNRKFNWLYILLSAIIALNGAMVGSVVWLARQERPIGQKQYNEILDQEHQLQKEIREIKLRLDRLEETHLERE